MNFTNKFKSGNKPLMFKNNDNGNGKAYPAGLPENIIPKVNSGNKNWYIDIGLMIVIFVVYYFSGKFGLKLAFENASATAVWAPTGIALAAYLLRGYRVWPAIALGAFAINISVTGDIISSVFITLGNTGEGLLGAYLVNKFANGIHAFEKPNTTFKFFLFTGIISTVLSAAIGVTSLALKGFVEWNNYFSVFGTWWMGDAVGAVLVAPLLILWLRDTHFHFRKDRIVEGICLLLVLLIVTAVSFNSFFITIPLRIPSYIMLPPFVWLAFRFKKRLVLTSVFLFCALAVWSTLNSQGPFVNPVTITLNTSLIMVQSFVCILTIMSLGFAVVIEQNNKSQETIRNNEKELRDFVENASVGLHWVGPDGTIKWANKTEMELLGYSPGEYIGHHIAEFHHDKNTIDDILTKLKNNETLNNYEAILKCKDGSVKTFLISSNAYMQNGKFIHTRCFSRDITEKKIIEEKLKTAEQKRFFAHQTYTTLFEATPDGILIVNDEGNYVDLNESYAQILGYTREEMIGRNFTEFMPPDRLNDAIESFKELKTGNNPSSKSEFPLPRKDGSMVQLEWVSKGQFLPGLNFCVARDITERKIADKKLFDELSFRKAVEESIPSGIASVDFEGTQTYVNPALCKMLGWSESELVGEKPPFVYWPFDEIQNIQDAFQQTLNGSAPPGGFELKFMNKNGEKFDVLVAVTPLNNYKNEPTGWLASVTNITERKKAQTALQEAHDKLEERVKERTGELKVVIEELEREITERKHAEKEIEIFEHTLKSTNDCVCITDLDEKIIFVNESFEKTYQYTQQEVFGKNKSIVRTTEMTDRLSSQIKKETLKGGWQGELLNKRKDGSVFPVHLSNSIVKDSNGEPIAIVGVSVDITEQKKTEELLQKQNSLVKLLQEITIEANRSLEVEKVLKIAVDKITDFTKWPIGHVYLVDKPGELIPTNIWNSGLDKAYSAFKKITESTPLKIKIGLPGRILDSGKPLWIPDVTKDDNFPRAHAAIDINVKSAFGFPVLSENEVVGVMEFFAPDVYKPDAYLLDIMLNIGTQLGRVIERQRSIETISANEARFRAVSETANDAIISADSSGNIYYFNKSAETIFGYDISEIIGKPLTIIMPERYKKMHIMGFSRYMKTGESRILGKTLELTAVRKNGDEFPVELSISQWETKDGIYFTGMIRDITERKLSEEHLKSSEKQLKDAQHLANVGSFEWNVSENKVTWSDELYNIYGLRAGEFPETFEGFLTLLHPEERERIKGIIEKSYSQNKPFVIEERILRPDGEVRTLLTHGDFIVDEFGKVTKLIGACQDITARKEAEEIIRTNEKQLRDAQQIAHLGSWEWYIDKDIIIWSDELFRIFGKEPSSLTPKYDDYLKMLPPDEVPFVNSVVQKALKDYQPFSFYHRLIFEDGSGKIIKATGHVELNQNGIPVKMFGTALDVTEQKQAEEMIQKSEKQLKDAQKIAHLGSWEWDLITNKVSWSEEMYRIYELEPYSVDPAAFNTSNLIHPDDRKEIDIFVEKLLKVQMPFSVYFRLLLPSGNTKTVKAEGQVEKDENDKVIRMYGSLQDVTEIKHAEEELRIMNEKLRETQNELIHSEKLASLGRFSSGIAHEIRNPLANISALAQIISKYNVDKNMKKHLRYILTNVDIANRIIKDLLNFASPQEVAYKKSDVRKIIDNLYNLVKSRCSRYNITLNKKISRKIPLIMLNEKNLQTAFLNFISNAIESMPDGGKLKVTADVNNLTNEVVILFEDTGVGISQENMDKVFEPFFTTKDEGTGLGLSLAYQVIRAHSGKLDISSKVNHGTKIEIRLPVTE